ncbi:hypothetical protein FSP39_006008 [Pinctada imbricata]|uniref:Glutathione S-transferase C-terminal domain-containing protein n=1 Tax=Pinctada imbricata TaxID=66713 RepID=A0AA88YB55_PINIB|nr:hypothetical protein FSP39_006008 [Pinctada imbricata]
MSTAPLVLGSRSLSGEKSIQNKNKTPLKTVWPDCKLTTADLALYEIMTMFKDHNLGEKCPDLGAHFKLIGELPKIKKYVAERPETQG